MNSKLKAKTKKELRIFDWLIVIFGLSYLSSFSCFIGLGIINVLITFGAEKILSFFFLGWAVRYPIKFLCAFLVMWCLAEVLYFIGKATNRHRKFLEELVKSE
ncbi:hypothetical protein SY111_00640 [Ligilactobacillus agilis]|uniref:Uncharacterized protein n=1 Tax=Ligilactobacillus agilis TaxID=1601 RepID=A0A6F9Y111_9LACO|nr:hypothetical protein [Ligilactobacillus agilis]GET06174.1 hypothetical protein SY212_12040 [Ligilactobacillus agilis]GET07440.1 hypothetical protein SY111_00640 [Ligilactobacillus agilis]GET11244.1 hypothetical protein SN10121_17340 [Ligilactobacillus agilis]